jgi:DNA-directed RNA polymerase subunit RPC12/RpoP
MDGRRRARFADEWRSIRAKRPGRCDLCGQTFTAGARIRYDPKTYRVRCPGACLTIEPGDVAPVAEPMSSRPRIPAHVGWQGEYVSLFDRGDYWFRKCVVCGRSFEAAAGRVAQAKKRGVCPACEERTPISEIERLTNEALGRDRERYRASQRANPKSRTSAG